MIRDLTRLLFLALPLSLLVGCPPGGNGNGNGNAAFGGLDRDGDGDLDADDLDAGEAAVYFETDLEIAIEDGEDTVEEGDTSSDVRLIESSGYSLEASFGAIGGVTFSLWLGTEVLAEGTIDVSGANAQGDDNAWYAYAPEIGEATVTLTSVTETTVSGHFEGEIVLEVLGEFEQATGETVTLTGFAFRDAERVLPAS